MIKKLYHFLSTKDKQKFILLFVLYLPVIFLETISIGSLPAFIIFILDPIKIIEWIDIKSLETLIFNLSDAQRAFYGLLIVAILFILKAVTIILVSYYELNFQKQIDLQTSKKLFSKYIFSNYLFHVYNNPSELTQNLNDIRRTTSVIFGFSTILKETLIICAISMVLIFSNFKLFLYLFLILIVPVLFLYNYFKNILVAKGEIARIFRTKRLKTISESLNNIKFIKLRTLETFVINYFKENNYKAIHQDMIASFVSKIPRIILETFAIITILTIVYYLYLSVGNIKDIIPILTLLIVSIVRFIPSVGNILISINNYKFHLPALKNFNLLFENPSQLLEEQDSFKSQSKITFENEINIENLSFHYPNNNIQIIKNLSFNIKKNQKIGIFGKSGKGKSTLLNLILGLYSPVEGRILSDKIEIKENLKSWHSQIGYVPQKITLFDETIKNNICFGVDNAKIDENHFKNIIKQTELESFISTLPQKQNSNVGHEGNIVSGGQLQRIGIARALYNKPKILILDEPTSSLDEEIESAIIKSLFKNSNLTVILISHNKMIIDMCDKVINLND